eukprot:TRINITY_DN1123_c0_g1_i2.p1 TRINITY_DN1123_c0_g1~~TRINITY_DN1123_c0_g1_i2.p1  ORF type:complete len:311 (+),score=44.52 TRINITY_DN1123_c0_g1_i2:67-933(+)
MAWCLKASVPRAGDAGSVTLATRNIRNPASTENYAIGGGPVARLGPRRVSGGRQCGSINHAIGGGPVARLGPRRVSGGRRVVRIRSTGLSAENLATFGDVVEVEEDGVSFGDRGRRVVRIRPTELSAESFAPFGQIVEAEEDGVPFGDQDAHLDLSQGTPRFYIMRLRDKDLTFNRITCHLRVTQCLGALGDHSRPWYLAVAEPSPSALDGKSGAPPLGPSPEQVRVFRIQGPCFLKLHRGTWHAGPLFEGPKPIDFYNLELSDTNVVDHTTHVFSVKDGVSFEIDDS